MRILCKEDTKFILKEESKDLYVLRVILKDSKANIEIWLLPFELEQLKDVINI